MARDDVRDVRLVPATAEPANGRTSAPDDSSRRADARAALLSLPVGLAFFVLAWHLAAAYLDRPYILPLPGAVVQELVDQRGLVAGHARATLYVIAGGLASGFALATVLGYIISRSRLLDRLITPYIVASQAVPVIAIAPLLGSWFGHGMSVRVVIAALVVFFPMLINTVVGLRGIPAAQRELMRSLSASDRQTLWMLEVPSSLPVLLAGVRVGVTLSVIGAVVGELSLGSGSGVGMYLQVARTMFDDALTYANIVVLVTLALALYGAASALERLLLRHH